MGKPVFLDPIDYISGKISKKYRTCYHFRNESKKRYTSVPGKRTTPVTPEEIVKRTRFAEVARAVNTRAHDLMQMTQDQSAFLAQKDQPGGKPTMKSYLWKLELAKYDASHNG